MIELTLTLHGVFFLLFASSAAGKVLAWRSFRETVASYGLPAAPVARRLAWLVPVAEAGAAVLWLLPGRTVAAAAATTGLLAALSRGPSWPGGRAIRAAAAAAERYPKSRSGCRPSPATWQWRPVPPASPSWRPWSPARRRSHSDRSSWRRYTRSSASSEPRCSSISPTCGPPTCRSARRGVPERGGNEWRSRCSSVPTSLCG